MIRSFDKLFDFSKGIVFQGLDNSDLQRISNRGAGNEHRHAIQPAHTVSFRSIAGDFYYRYLVFTHHYHPNHSKACCTINTAAEEAKATVKSPRL